MLEDAAAAQRKIVMQEAEEKQLRAQVCDLTVNLTVITTVTVSLVFQLDFMFYLLARTLYTETVFLSCLFFVTLLQYVAVCLVMLLQIQFLYVTAGGLVHGKV